MNNALEVEHAWIKKINKTIDNWLLNNYQRVTGFIPQHLNYWDVDNLKLIIYQNYWDVDNFKLITHQNYDKLIDYTLTYNKQIVSRLIIWGCLSYKIENDDGFVDEGKI